MPSFCAVLECSDKYGHGQNVPFHKFPTKNKELLEKWIAFTQRPKDWCPSKWMSICGLHFRDEDYRCLEQKKLLKKNAVPCLRTLPSLESASVTSSKQNASENEELAMPECSIKEIVNSVDKSNVNCRFCGSAVSNYVSFSGNFEMFGIIQKCLPTLSILQDDNLPKEICVNCLKRLENFARFIDKVLETQATLLRQFRTEKGTTNKSNERILKIKQEPVVRVKQENLDDLNAFFPDEVDDGCCGEQDNDVSNTGSQLDQKFQFCDFPVLNDQDIINNCDIMEIINLSDPFIDITNCENTITEEGQQKQQQNLQDTLINQTLRQQSLFSAHELLQSHMLLEEHNYAYSAEDFKEEWKFKNCYKTEKVEVDDYEPDVSIDQALNEVAGQDIHSSIGEQFVNDSEVAATETVETTSNIMTIIPVNNLERSNKPIVTSISAINETSIVPLTQICTNTNSIAPEKLPSSRKKPNIVVLNESIVQSSHTFPLQACTICQLKFFGIDSLNQHYTSAHNAQTTNHPPVFTTQPMVSLPASNISTWNNNFYQESTNQYQSYKLEKDIGVENTNTEVTILDNSRVQRNESENESLVPKRSSKNEIKILDMQQSFLQHQYIYGYQPQQGLTVASNVLQIPATTETLSCFSQVLPSAFETDTAEQHVKKKSQAQSTRNAVFPDEYTTNMLPNPKPLPDSEAYVAETRLLPNGRDLERIAANYMALKKRYYRLQLKCRSLVSNGNSKHRHIKKSAFRCRICGSEFNNVFQLIRHKQSLASHHIRKPRSRYFRSCVGCEKFFCNKIALHNHMRFICQSLPLRWLKTPIRTFKCRYCRRITFTHWRLYRRHEVNCRRKKSTPSKISTSNRQRVSNFNANYIPTQLNSLDNFSIPKRLPQTKASLPKERRVNKVSNKSQTHICLECKKVFSTASSLIQHGITHSDLRVHQCKICQRVFKRRHGLSQHIRGFHMKVKPFECPICKYCYSLKSDMRRCKHSSLGRRGSKNAKKENV